MTSLHLSAMQRWIVQSPPVEWSLRHIRELALGALRQGPMPQHIAFVMDGNRRYARKNGIEVVEGHNLGFEALARVLEVCYKSGVRVVTVYAFSIENFKRSKYEVEALMEMAKTKISELAVHGELLDRYGARIQFLGQKDMIRPDVLEAIDKAVDMTSSNSRAVLNICAPYTSRDEMTEAIRRTVIDYSKPITPMKRPFSATHIAANIRAQNLGTVSEESANSAQAAKPSEFLQSNGGPASGSSSRNPSPHPSGTSQYSADATSTTATSNVHDSKAWTPKYPDPETITTESIDSHTFTAGMPPLDLLVRTSGVERLSDFMLWQCHENTEIIFLDCLWPEFDLWQFMPVMVEWQWRRKRGGDLELARGRRRRRAADFATSGLDEQMKSAQKSSTGKDL